MVRTDVVYGRRAVAEAQRGRRRVHRVLTSDGVGEAELTRVAGSPEHQGIVAEVDPYPYADPAELIRPPDALVVALDEVQDPHNLGAVCRSAEAAGASGVVICERRAVGITPAVCKASAGAVEHLRVARVGNLADWLAAAKETEGLWVHGAAAGAPATHTSADFTGRVVLVMGSEGRGLRPRVEAMCDTTVAIPLHGKIDSLNVSAAAAVLLWEVDRQRGRAQSGQQ